MQRLQVGGMQGLQLSAAHWRQMQDYVEQQAPLEACGLLAGRGRQVLEVIPVSNALRSPTRFRMDPQEQIDAFNYIDDQGWELLGIYHSHPRGPDHPSAEDLRQAAYPGVVHLIWSKAEGDWRCQAFVLNRDSYEEVPLVVDQG